MAAMTQSFQVIIFLTKAAIEKMVPESTPLHSVPPKVAGILLTSE